MRRLAVVVGALVILAISAVVVQAATTGDERIYACVNNGDGTMRQVAGPEVTCPKGWHALSWSAENPPASPALTTYENAGDVVIVAAEGSGRATARCDEGDVATGGGYSTSTSTGIEVNGSSMITLFDNTGWQATAANTTTVNLAFRAFVVCLDTTP
jgi:hypothetical protein